MERVFSRFIKDLPEGKQLDRPLRVKSLRILQRKQKPTLRSGSLWSSLSTIVTAAPAAGPAQEPEAKVSAPSPARQVACGQSGTSSPRRSSRKLPAMPSTSSSVPRKRPLMDEEKKKLRNYGSEEDSDTDEDDEGTGLANIVVPRVARMFLPDDEEKEISHRERETPSFEWPPEINSSATQPEIVNEWEHPSTPEVSINPYCKFEFNWRPFPHSQIPPELRREPFSNIDCGPTIPLVSPHEAFTAIWDHEIMEHIAIETNRYAEQLATEMLENGKLRPNSRISKWRDTDVRELYVYFAIIIATGIVLKSRIEEYWNKTQDIFSTPGFTASMNIDRFLLLSKCLHFSDNESFNLLAMTRSEAKLFKIKPLIDHLNKKFQNLYNLSQNIALDESLTMWKGWLDINQFIHNKAATVGIKTYEVCESQTGYLWRFEVHAGHDTSSDPEDPVSGTIPALVLRLLNGLENKGHTIWMDNFYNSPVLARELKVRGFDCVGTLRTNRQFVPVALSTLSKQDMAVGQVCGCTSGDVDIVVWRDKKCVALISTYHGLATVKCGDTLKPTIIPDYNICMGGVDRKDQMLAMYPIERKRGRVWYKKFFRRLLNVSVLNAYRLLTTPQPMTHRNFRLTLVKQLIGQHAPSVAPAMPAGHFPAQYNFLAGKSHERQRRPCAVCQKRTTAYCRKCNVPLCVFTCFEPHHT